MAALELTCRIVQALQTTAETAYDIVSPGPSVRDRKNKGQKGRRKRYSQPLDIREGVANAYTLVKEVRHIQKLYIRSKIIYIIYLLHILIDKLVNSILYHKLLVLRNIYFPPSHLIFYSFSVCTFFLFLASF